MANKKGRSVFKDWVPYWLVLITIFITVMPIGSVLGIYIAGTKSAMSFYGVDAMDVNYSVVAYYLAIACSFPLEARFFNFFASKPYWVGCSIIYVLINLLLYVDHSFVILVALRFLGGMLSLGFIGMMFSLVFRQFHEQRSRVLGYATMYAALFSSGSLAQLLDAYLFSKYNFNALFLVKIFSALPGIVMMFVILKPNIDLRKEGKVPLKKIDWQSYVLYSSFFMLLAYVVLNGQYYNWFESSRIVILTMVLVIILMLFVIRQIRLRLPYLDLRVFKARNFRIGMLLLVVLYIGKGDMGMLNGYFLNSVHLDEFHKGYVMLVNAIGIIAGALVSARFILARRRIRLIWMTGFAALFLYHILILRTLSFQADTISLLLPIFFQGFGNGILIVSIVIFYATAVPAEIGFSASVIGVAFRAATFTVNMAIMNYAGLWLQSFHKVHLQEQLTSINPFFSDRMHQYSNLILNAGGKVSDVAGMSGSILAKSVSNQANLLFVRDYYFYMSLLMVLVIMAIALIPHFHYHLRKIGTKLLPI